MMYVCMILYDLLKTLLELIFYNFLLLYFDVQGANRQNTTHEKALNVEGVRQ